MICCLELIKVVGDIERTISFYSESFFIILIHMARMMGSFFVSF